MDPFLGQIVLFGGNFAPRGWALCEGQLLPISQYSALFSILGTIYGGDGRTTFALPDLRGRAAISSGRGPGLSDRRLGSRSGQEVHTLTTLEMPSHNHLTTNTSATDQHIQLSTTKAVNDTPQTGDVPAAAQFGAGLGATPVKAFGPPTAGNVVNGQTLSGNAGLTILNNGGSQAHNIMQPYLTTNYIIALQGVFPSRN
ncbi:phage tail protein [Tenacibaculum ovolyticum]|uniref:phage tail protein n=1 Tax=Tenacibaculum ovolyticum TaxID=104270 RepID=UPI001F184CD3|nr:tail fiber protein [Tenacibaculum ovolyticum]